MKYVYQAERAGSYEEILCTGLRVEPSNLKYRNLGVKTES